MAMFTKVFAIALLLSASVGVNAEAAPAERSLLERVRRGEHDGEREAAHQIAAQNDGRGRRRGRQSADTPPAVVAAVAVSSQLATS